ncbi:MAG: DUF6640 family protein [Alphaproteobacteria bacterium]
MSTSILIAKILISLLAVLQAFGPMKADFNQTHATNPLWPAHARFHVVWQVLTQAGVSGFVLFLLWAVPSETNNWIAAFLAFNWIISFFINLAVMGKYDGALKDVNGIKPFKFNIGGKIREVDTNLFGCSLMVVIAAIIITLLTVG